MLHFCGWQHRVHTIIRKRIFCGAWEPEGEVWIYEDRIREITSPSGRKWKSGSLLVSNKKRKGVWEKSEANLVPEWNENKYL
jgi:hypothetical protein